MIPEVVDIEFSAYCNLKCGFCFGPTDDRSKPNLPTSFWMDALEWLRDYGVKGVVISGGEPTIHKDIVQLLSHSKQLGLSVVMSTHGQFKDRVLKCAKYTDWIALPIDGVSNLMLRKMRGVEWDIHNAQDLIGSIRQKYPMVRFKIGTVATKQNSHEVSEIGVALVEEKLPINTWKIYQYTARRQFKHRWKEFHISNDEYTIIKKKVLQAVMNPQFDIVFSSNESRKRAYLFVYPDGTVAIPNVGLEMEDLIIGNLSKEGPSVLKRVDGVCLSNHLSNYSSTYPAST